MAVTGTGRPVTTTGGGRTIGVGTTGAGAGGIEEATVAEIGVMVEDVAEASLLATRRNVIGLRTAAASAATVLRSLTSSPPRNS